MSRFFGFIESQESQYIGDLETVVGKTSDRVKEGGVVDIRGSIPEHVNELEPILR